jgi:hypothetical protein
MIAVSTALFCNVGCDKPGAAEQQKENAAIQDNQQSQQSYAQQSAQSQANAQDKINSAQADFDKTRGDYSRDRQVDLKEVDDRVSKLEQRANTATGPARARMQQDLATIRTQRAAFAADVRSITGVVATEWDQFKSKVDDEYNALRDHLDKAS